MGTYDIEEFLGCSLLLGFIGTCILKLSDETLLEVFETFAV